MNFIEYVRQQIAWSTRTFGPGRRTKGVLAHIRKELVEIEEHPTDLSEWIDVIILATDGAWRAGYTAEQVAQALFDKQTKNINRVWPDWRGMSEDEAIEHDRSVDLSGLQQASKNLDGLYEDARSKGLMPPLPYICKACGVQQFADGRCANCGRKFTVVENANFTEA